MRGHYFCLVPVSVISLVIDWLIV